MYYKKYIKRILDFLFALLLVPLFLLSCGVVGICIYLEDKGSIFYKAERRGMNGKIYSMLKFRSMKMNAPDIRNKDGSTFNSKNDNRITKTGKIIRKTSIDELPQILNVLKGDMSFVGPRAPIPKEGYEWNDLDEMKQKRLLVRPGITGYSAALFRNSISARHR